MPSRKMHADELEIDAGLVGRLLAAQVPQWADWPIERVPSSGTDNALYRLGGDLVARLPRIGSAVGGLEKELRVLPLLAPLLPVEVPLPLAEGAPGEGYPWPWAVYRWLDGRNPTLRATGTRTRSCRTRPRSCARCVGSIRSADRPVSAGRWPGATRPCAVG